jgi:hypothetical protein
MTDWSAGTIVRRLGRGNLGEIQPEQRADKTAAARPRIHSCAVHQAVAPRSVLRILPFRAHIGPAPSASLGGGMPVAVGLDCSYPDVSATVLP